MKFSCLVLFKALKRNKLQTNKSSRASKECSLLCILRWCCGFCSAERNHELWAQEEEARDNPPSASRRLRRRRLTKRLELCRSRYFVCFVWACYMFGYERSRIILQYQPRRRHEVITIGELLAVCRFCWNCCCCWCSRKAKWNWHCFGISLETRFPVNCGFGLVKLNLCVVNCEKFSYTTKKCGNAKAANKSQKNLSRYFYQLK